MIFLTNEMVSDSPSKLVRFPCKLQNTLTLEDLAEYLHSFTRLSVHDVFVLFTHVALA